VLQFTVRPSLLLKTLTALTVTLVGLHFAGWALRHTIGLEHGRLTVYARWFDLSAEQAVPAWVSSAVLLLVALAASDMAVRARTAPGGARGRWGYWALLALVFTYLSLDETVGVHEELNEVSAHFVGREGILYYGWYVIALPIVAVFALVMARWLRTLPRRTSTRMVLAGVLYVGGAIGFELVGNALLSAGQPADGILLATEAAFEEGLELSGVSLFLTTVVAFAQSRPIRDAAHPPVPLSARA